MSYLNPNAITFVPKIIKSYTEEDFMTLKNELTKEKEKRIKCENDYTTMTQQLKVYVENVENMKLEYTKQYTVISIKHSALQDIRDVLYEQITSLHSEIEKYKEKNKKYEKERSELMEELDKLKVIEKEKLSLETEIEKIKGDLKTMCENYNQLLYQHTQNINVQQQASNYYPYYYYPYYQSTP